MGQCRFGTGGRYAHSGFVRFAGRTGKVTTGEGYRKSGRQVLRDSPFQAEISGREYGVFYHQCPSQVFLEEIVSESEIAVIGIWISDLCRSISAFSSFHEIEFQKVE